jgi:hypothetical protein
MVRKVIQVVVMGILVLFGLLGVVIITSIVSDIGAAVFFSVIAISPAVIFILSIPSVRRTLFGMLSGAVSSFWTSEFANSKWGAVIIAVVGVAARAALALALLCVFAWSTGMVMNILLVAPDMLSILLMCGILGMSLWIDRMIFVFLLADPLARLILLLTPAPHDTIHLPGIDPFAFAFWFKSVITGVTIGVVLTWHHTLDDLLGGASIMVISLLISLGVSVALWLSRSMRQNMETKSVPARQPGEWVKEAGRAVTAGLTNGFLLIVSSFFFRLL